ncbi:beta-methylarginine biosynthesis bifunctional aminotransferase [Polyangium fumosum]|uniref:Beta-methylarginine biosynthesis bifunctional aminotransferase n=1 Tax=Polyangium fumosum TaxID=889272 RepID=A0A4U1IVT1_9BACT|nr:beta-methylarginine biosynthesis bifunctional aminotransferase [Polyangium fumosum]TKC98585.1 beta-methylarginine biosynthesis bifunctional aminotransferase [Polyangium fumosum]
MNRANAARPRCSGVVSDDSPLSTLQQRLLYMERFPERRFVNIVENVPQWPSVEGAPDSAWRYVHNYAPSRGQRDLLERIAARESRRRESDVTLEQILVTNGALHALAMIFRQHQQPGAVALCQAPVLGAVPEMLRSYGYRPAFFKSLDGRVDIAALRRLHSSDVRMIYLNTPLNPSGDILAPDTLEQLCALAHELGAILVADMVYDSYAFDHARVTSPQDLGVSWKNVYVVNSMSKNFGSPGLRVGWIVSTPENVHALLRVLELENISVCGLSQAIASDLLDRGNAVLVEAVRAGRQMLSERLPQIAGIRFCVPAGGTQIFAELPVTDVEEFCDFALAELGLCLVSASNYEGVQGAFVRLPMGAPPGTLENALALLGAGLDAYRERTPLP